MLHLEHTLGTEIHDILPTAKRELAGALPMLLLAIQDEVTVACLNNFSLSSSSVNQNEVLLIPTATNLVSQITTRVIVGKELCRKPEFLRLAMDLTHELAFISVILDWCPRFLRGFLVSMLPFSSRKKRLKDMMANIIKSCAISSQSFDNKGLLQSVCQLLTMKEAYY